VLEKPQPNYMTNQADNKGLFDPSSGREYRKSARFCKEEEVVRKKRKEKSVFIG
jgi:hypothetical protein